MSSDIKIRVQSFGRFLSNMVMPNIGAFIAWGIITALFIPTGWLPNETLAKLVGPMITYLLPLLIGYTGGKLVGGERGGVVGAITTMGVIVGADMPMFLGSMIAGPLGGYCIKKFDAAVDGKIKSGFEMLVNNFSAGIIGMILAILAFLGIGPAVEVLSHILASGVNFMVAHDMLPLASIFVEPAKILFLNNAINHGIFSPLGIQQSHDLGKSIFFLIEANPGPGMGVLLAYMFFGRGSAKQSAGRRGDHPLPRRYSRNLLPVRADEPAPDPRGDPRRHDRRVYPDHPQRRPGLSGFSGFHPGGAGNDAEGRLLR
ncbi:EIICBA-Mtl [Pluralibacter gergoviae]|nr:EIICBA-Mtl [Pluralibacter gergoviae]